jgi:hypothetical protein
MALLYVGVFVVACLAIAAGVGKACRWLDVPKLIGEKWVLIPVLMPWPLALLCTWVVPPRKYALAVRAYLERKGYVVNNNTHE